MTSVFTLRSDERLLHGVRLRSNRLVIGPSGAQVIQASLFLTLGLLIGVLITWSSATNGSISGALSGAVVLICSTAAGIGLLCRRVVADSEGLSLQTAIQTRVYQWSCIRSIKAVNSTERRTALRVGSRGILLRVHPIGSWSIGQIELRDESTVLLPSFVSAAQGEGLSMGSPTATERRVALLKRYRESIV